MLVTQYVLYIPVSERFLWGVVVVVGLLKEVVVVVVVVVVVWSSMSSPSAERDTADSAALVDLVGGVSSSISI